MNVTAPLREIREFSCRDAPRLRSDLTGVVALFEWDRIHCTIQQIYQRLAAKGVVAVLGYGPQEPGVCYYLRDSSEFKSMSMHSTPFLEISKDDAETLIEAATADGMIKLLLEPTVPNVWRQMYDSMWWMLLMRALPASLAGTTAWFAYQTFMQRRIHRGEIVSFAMVVLLCEMILSVALTFVCALGAWFSTDNFSESVHTFFFPACPGGGLFSSLAMLCYWRQQMAVSGRRLPALELSCYKRPTTFIGALAVGTIGIIDGAIALMACYIIELDVLRAIYPYLVVVQLAVAVIFFANAHRVGVNICAMLQSKVGREHRPRLLRLGFLLPLSGICMICQLAGSVFLVMFHNTPLARFVGVNIALLGRLGTSLAQVSSLGVSTARRKSSRQIHPLFSSNAPTSANVASLHNARPDPQNSSSIKLLIIPKGVAMCPPDQWRATAAATSSPPTTLMATLPAQPRGFATFMLNLATGLREWSSVPRDDIEAEMLALPIEKLFGLWLRDLDDEPVGWRLSVRRLVPQPVGGCVANHFACQLEKVAATSVFACIALRARDCNTANGSTISSISSGVSSESMACSADSIAVCRESFALFTATVRLWIAVLPTGEAPARSTTSSAMDPPPPARCPVGIEIPTADHGASVDG